MFLDILNTLNDVAVIGWTVGYNALLDHLDQAASLKVIKSDSFYEIVSVNEYGTFTIQVSAESGWLPKSFELIKESRHLTYGGRVGDVFENKVNSIVWKGKCSKFETMDGDIIVPKDVEISRLTDFKENPNEEIKTYASIESISFSPSLDSAFSGIVIPVGFEVTVRNASHIPYRWDGKTAVPGIPELARNVSAPAIFRGSGANRLVSMSLLFVVLIVACAVLYRRIRTS